MKLTSIAVNQTLVTIEDSEFYFSYNTCVAVKNKKGKFRIDSPSKTTTKHMRNMNVLDWEIISEEELAAHLPTTLPPLTK
ncbi:MAG: hypothetical protein IPP10_15600 [Candidatus Competibacteraceae bacterium]|nr:hypothetical protein [Candidatus Competibacteraceae bacterium]